MNKKLLINYYSLKSKLMQVRFRQLQFKKWQDRQMRDIVKYAYLRSPFYHGLYRNSDISKIHELPVIDKKLMMDHFIDFNTMGISKDEALLSSVGISGGRESLLKAKKILVSESAGTSGSQSLFLSNSLEECRWVGAFFARAIPFSFMNHQKIALFMNPNVLLNEGFVNRKMQFKYFDMVKPTIDQIRQLENFRPTILVAAPSILRSISALKQELRLRFCPRKIFSIAEVLEPIDQDYIEEVFEQKLHQIYQASEGFLGITCSQNVMHLNEDLIVFEEEDLGQGRFIPIITKLTNDLQPLIRYRLDDVLIRGEPRCACGSYFRTIEKVECRKEDVFVFYNLLKNKRIYLYPDYIRQAILTVSDQIEEYKITQEYANHLKVQLKVISAVELSTLETRIQRSFNEVFKRFNISPIQIEISYVYEKNFSFSKTKRVERLFRSELSP